MMKGCRTLSWFGIVIFKWCSRVMVCEIFFLFNWIIIYKQSNIAFHYDYINNHSMWKSLVIIVYWKNRYNLIIFILVYFSFSINFYWPVTIVIISNYIVSTRLCWYFQNIYLGIFMLSIKFSAGHGELC